MIRIASASSQAPVTANAVDDCLRTLTTGLGTTPQYILVVAGMRHALAEVGARTLRACPGVTIHGLTSCLGVTTADGLVPGGLGMLAIADATGSFTSCCLPYAGNPRHAAQLAALQAIQRAGRPGTPPALMLVTSTPGCEEMVLAGIQDAVGAMVPIVGGSAADDTVAGHWSVLGGGDAATAGCTVSAWHPSCRVAHHFSCGYEPSGRSGIITAVRGRLVATIDDLPAARWYNDAIGGALSARLAGGGPVLMDTTLHPLGRIACRVAGIPHYQLSHPERFTADGALGLFSETMIGEQVTVMSGTSDSLVHRAGRVVSAALNHHDPTDDTVLGAFCVYCAGCMLTVRGRMGEVAQGLRRALHDAPFITAHTFGEQGCFPDGTNRHGNLMINAVVLRP